MSARVVPKAPPPLRPADAEARYESRRVQLDLLLTQSDFKVTPALASVLDDGAVRRVLLGARAEASVAFPAGLGATAKESLALSLQVLADRLGAVTGQRLFVDGGETRLTLTNQRPEPSLEAPARRHAKDDWSVPASREAVRPVPAREVGPTSLRTMSIIAYCRTPTDLTNLKEVLASHEKNFQTFGFAKDASAAHATRGMTVVLTDDSPPPMDAQVRALTEQLTQASKSGARFLYLGAEREQAFHQAIEQAALASPKVAGHGLSQDDVRAALSALFGSGAGDGVGRNRNNSMLAGLALSRQLPESEGKGRFFQLDHDQMLLALDKNASVRRARLEGEKPKVPGPNVKLDVDTIGAFEGRSDADALATANFTGGIDLDIASIVLEFPRPTEKAYLGQPGDDWLDGPTAGTMTGSGPDSITRSATTFGPRGAVWGSATRNQDIELGLLYGNRPVDGAWVLHREAAGSKWGSRANLLWDDLVSNATMLLDAQSLGNAPATVTSGSKALVGKGEAMLKGLEAPDWTRVNDTIRDTLDTVKSFFSASERALGDLEALRAKVAGADPAVSAEAVARWVHGKPLETLTSVKRKACEAPASRERTLAGIEQAKAQVEAQRAAMRERFGDGSVSDTLRRTVHREAARNARNLAISYLFAPEIVRGAEQGMRALFGEPSHD
ncbi:MAG: hypothetical protein K1X89_01340 [Myxococcaceae bacterium]|nr:hypothetical protein [Myxococcaceae bacterium]